MTYSAVLAAKIRYHHNHHDHHHHHHHHHHHLPHSHHHHRYLPQLRDLQRCARSKNPVLVVFRRLLLLLYDPLHCRSWWTLTKSGHLITFNMGVGGIRIGFIRSDPDLELLLINIQHKGKPHNLCALHLHRSHPCLDLLAHISRRGK